MTVALPERPSASRNGMKAIVQDTCGSTDVLEFRDIDKPEIADDEVLVRAHAAGVDRGAIQVPVSACRVPAKRARPALTGGR